MAQADGLACNCLGQCPLGMFLAFPDDTVPKTGNLRCALWQDTMKEVR